MRHDPREAVSTARGDPFQAVSNAIEACTVIRRNFAGLAARVENIVCLRKKILSGITKFDLELLDQLIVFRTVLVFGRHLMLTE